MKFLALKFKLVNFNILTAFLILFRTIILATTELLFFFFSIKSSFSLEWGIFEIQMFLQLYV